MSFTPALRPSAAVARFRVPPGFAPIRAVSIRRWLLAATIILAVPSALTFALSQRRATDVLEQVHYSDVFDAGQIQAALLRLDADLGRYAIAPTPEGADTVSLRFDVLMNHVDVLDHGLVGQAVEAINPGLVGRIHDATSIVGPLVARLDSVETARRALALLTPLEASVAEASSYVSGQSAAIITTRADALRSTSNTLLVLTTALLMAALGLAIVLWRQHTDMRRLAYRDALTGLANRPAFYAALQQDCGGDSLAVLLIDLDNFKDVNDSFGHDVGDALLRRLAARLIAAVPEARVVARLGGDEFAVLLGGPITALEASAVAARLCASAEEPFRVGELMLRSGLSIGLLVDTARNRDPVSLLKRADLALYAAKGSGRGRLHLFDPALEIDFQSRREMEDDLRAAVADDTIAVHFQPLVDLATGRPVICEALARWDHPRHGRVPPSEFIPIAERSALIVDLGHRVLARACAEAATWSESLRVAVNVSSQQILKDDFTERVAAILADTGLDARRLELEITESVLLRTDRGVLDTIGRLRQLGVTFALDDFGTGYSSLGRLHHLPLDKIKIDQSFTRAMEGSKEALGIVETIIDLARKLGVATTAEGIETESQHRLLLRAGCQQGQGYLYAKPMPAELCRRWLDTPRDHGTRALEAQPERVIAPAIRGEGIPAGTERSRRSDEVSPESSYTSASMAKSEPVMPSPVSPSWPDTSHA